MSEDLSSVFVLKAHTVLLCVIPSWARLQWLMPIAAWWMRAKVDIISLALAVFDDLRFSHDVWSKSTAVRRLKWFFVTVSSTYTGLGKECAIYRHSISELVKYRRSANILEQCEYSAFREKPKTLRFEISSDISLLSAPAHPYPISYSSFYYTAHDF